MDLRHLVDRNLPFAAGNVGSNPTEGNEIQY